MSYPGDNPGNRQHYNSYRSSSSRGRSSRGSRGGYSSTRYQYNGGGYEENAGRFGGSANKYRGNYRGDYYVPQRSNQGVNNRGSYAESSSRYEKRASSSSLHETRPSPQPHAERPHETLAAETTSQFNTPQKTHVTDFPSYFLTGLNEYTNDEQERSKIRSLLRGDEEIDAKLEEQKLQLCKSELELGLLSTQSEKDALNVQLTQENLDAILLMQ
ncbi:LAME_0H08460g1_1 [Lachancea meyersii CBS 8951]|uniref:LAME_0H08460g1_1 n=1 Tax=Lachancea meyersii CBS 8951 TaxID=1266667 RepID=A0A1G4KFB9_9SACH|nr:LAME_0H08460g1_1 [Lachancea meyersii CBS 8951]